MFYHKELLHNMRAVFRLIEKRINDIIRLHRVQRGVTSHVETRYGNGIHPRSQISSDWSFTCALQNISDSYVNSLTMWVFLMRYNKSGSGVSLSRVQPPWQYQLLLLQLAIIMYASLSKTPLPGKSTYFPSSISFIKWCMNINICSFRGAYTATRWNSFPPRSLNLAPIKILMVSD